MQGDLEEARPSVPAPPGTPRTQHLPSRSGTGQQVLEGCKTGDTQLKHRSRIIETPSLKRDIKKNLHILLPYSMILALPLQRGTIHSMSEHLQRCRATAQQGSLLYLCVAVFFPFQPEICLPLASSQWAFSLPWNHTEKFNHSSICYV